MKILPILAVSLFCVPCAADDADDLYESLENVRLGRLFMTEADRLALDARRSVSTVNAAAEGPDTIETDGQPEVNVRRRPAAGYIASGDGTALVWVNGGFRRVALTEAERLKFPGAVRIRSRTAQLSEDAVPGGETGGRQPSVTQPEEE